MASLRNNILQFTHGGQRRTLRLGCVSPKSAERWMHAQPRTFAADDGFWTWWDATDTDTVSRIDLYVVWPAYRPTLRERVYAILAGWWVRLNAKEGTDAARGR